MGKKTTSQQGHSTKNKKKVRGLSWLLRRLVLLLLVSIPLFVIWAFVTGELQFVETSRFGGEAWGYFGTRSKLMDSPENFEEAFNQLSQRKEFKESKPSFLDIYYNQNRISATIPVPNTDNHIDSYTYEGRYFFSRWSSQPSHFSYDFDDQQNLMEPVASIDEIDLEAMYHFYKQIQDYQEEHQIEPKFDSTPSASLRINYDENQDLKIHLTGELSGVRQSVSFRAKANGEDFEIDTGSGFPSDHAEWHAD